MGTMREGGFRHELKYEIGDLQYRTLRSRVRAVMRADPHAGAEGTYRIRSVYFDNYNDRGRNSGFGITMTIFPLLRWKRR